MTPYLALDLESVLKIVKFKFYLNSILNASLTLFIGNKSIFIFLIFFLTLCEGTMALLKPKDEA